MSFRQFADKVAVVTGGASGMGRALCRELSQGGATVVVADLNIGQAETVAAAIVANGGRAGARLVDVSQEEQVQELIDGTVRDHGRIDYLFNNAGIALFGDARDLTLQQWRQVLAVNLHGVVSGTIIAYKTMARQGFGHIVNVASSAGLSPAPTETAYCTSKYAVVGLSLSLRPEGADLGVKVSVVCPGYVRTGMFQTAAIINVAPERRGVMSPSGLRGQGKSAPMVLNPRKTMDASQAARTILKGVLRNQAIIAFPAGVRVEWLLNRLVPGLMDRLLLMPTRDFRRYRSEGVAKNWDTDESMNITNR